MAKKIYDKNKSLSCEQRKIRTQQVIMAAVGVIIIIVMVASLVSN